MDVVDKWDLEAVVRGCCFKRPSTTTPSTAAMTDPFSSFPSLVPNEVDKEKDLLFDFPGLNATETAFRELEDLCKPFFHKPHQQPLQQESLLFPQQRRPSSSPAMADPYQTQRQPSRPKRRGYYRCSGSKGCLARKQVERSRTDPAMLVVTYTAEHNHPLPTHRSSLAGGTRQKVHPLPASAVTSPSVSCGGQDGDWMPPSSPPSSYVEEEHLRQREDEEEVLTVADIQMVGEEDMLFLEFGQDGRRTGVDAANLPAISGFYADEGGFSEHFFAPTWTGNSNATALAGGGQTC